MKKNKQKILLKVLKNLLVIFLVVNVQVGFGQKKNAKEGVSEISSVKKRNNILNGETFVRNSSFVNQPVKVGKKKKKKSEKKYEELKNSFLKSNVKEITSQKSSKVINSPEGFETSVPPTGWIEYQETGTNSWAQTTTRVNNGTYSSFFDDFSGDNTVWLISDPIDLDAYTSEFFSYYENVNFGSYADYHYVLYSDDYSGSGDPNLATWYIVNDVIGTEDTWVQKQYDISALTGNSVYFAFLYIGNYASEWYIDDYEITGSVPVACTTPTNQPTALSLTPAYTTIDGTFTAATSSPDGYLVVVSTDPTLSNPADLPVDGVTYVAGNTIGDGTVVQSGAGTTFTATGLTPNTQYYFFIFSQNYSCTGGPLYRTSSPLTGNSTTLGAFSIPYSHNFDTQDGWATSGTASIWERGNQTVAPFGHSGQTVYGTVLNANYATDNVDAYLETPVFDMAGGVAPRLSFWMDMDSETGWDGGTVQISLNGGTWTTIDPLDYISNTPNDADVDGLANNENGWSGTVPAGDWVKTEFNVFSLTNTGVVVTNADIVQFRFWFGSDGSGNTYSGWYIDDFEIYEPNDQTTQVDAPTSGQIPANNISSLINTSASAVDVFKFDLTDQGSGDGVSSFVTTFVITNEGSGTADWTDNIAGAELWSGGSIIPDLNVTITDTEITFTKNSGNFEVADGTSEEITMKLWLKSSGVVDNSTMIFEVPTTSHGFVATPSGSEFADPFIVATTSNTQTIRIIATQLFFSGQPTNTASSNVALSTQPIVSATDANGNIDEDITSNVTLSNSGTLTMANNSMIFVAGVADFGTPNNFMFTSGGEYVMLSASDGTLNSVSPSTEIAVDVVGCTIFTEDFNAVPVDNDLTGAGGWEYTEITNSPNDWGIGNTGANRFLTIYDNNTQQQYNNGNNGEIIAYYNTLIDATNYKNLTIDFDWQCNGEASSDYGTVVWSTDAVNWSIAEITEYEGQATFTTTNNVDLSVCDGQQFYIGFRWINDGSVGTNPPFAIDNLEIKGFPKFDYNFSYRQDGYTQITGTVVTLDGNDGANISLPVGYNFSYDGVPVTAIRANLNGWLEMGTSQTGSPLASNNLTDVLNTPLLAPFWDNLSSDAQTRIIYLIEGTTPTRTFTVEWKDVLSGTKRQNFQVKLYETSNVIEFWYGDMNTNSGGSASVGINNTGGCLNKMISIIPGNIPTASYTAENNSINSATYLNSGLVYIFNPLIMQSYSSWEAATTVVGQVDFTASSTAVNQSTTPNAKASTVSSKGVLAVGSGEENRVMIWNSVPTTNGAPADFVIGQTDFTSNGSATTQTGLYFVNCVAFSPDGNKLLVAEGNNKRVLIYDMDPVTGRPTGNGQAASVVIGQDNFTTQGGGCSATRFEPATGLLVTPDGKLFISDPNNNRILVFNSIPTTNGAAADYVIGQADLTSNSAGSGANQLDGVWDCAYSPEGKLLVADNGNNNRILIFNNVPTANNASADLVIGNTNFGASAPACSKTKLRWPSVTMSVEGKIAVADFNHRVLIYNRVPSVNNAPADYVLGQPNFDTDVAFNDGFDNTGSPSNKNIQAPYSICFDLNGRLFVNGAGMNRVMIYGDTPTETADLELSIISNETDVCVYSDVEYTVQVTNNGGDPASSIVVNAQLPVDFIATGYKTSVGTYNQKSGYWSIPYIAVGETVTLTFEGEVQAGLGGTNVTAYANIIASKQLDSDFTNNGDNQVVAVKTFSAPTSTDIADQYINRNSHTIPVISFTVDDADGIGDISSYTCSSSNTTLIPLNYTTNLLFAGAAPDKELDIFPTIDEYGYSDMELIITDSHGCYKAYDFKVAVGNIWEGDDNIFGTTKWDNNLNWSSGGKPTTTKEAIIPTNPIGGFFPIIDVVGAECEDLIIEPRASVTLNDTYRLSVDGDMTIQSDITGTGSLVDLNTNGNISNKGAITIERYLISDAWHYLSSPLSGVTNKVLTESVCGTNYNGNVLDYNEAYAGTDWLAGWEWPWLSTPNNNPLVVTNGYAYYTEAGTCANMVKFTGAAVSLNTGDYTYTVTNQDDTHFGTDDPTNPHRGWNLVGNPYPSGLNADEFMTANAGVIDGTVYFWDELGSTGFNTEGADYAAYNTAGGGVTGSGSGSVVPDQYISCGQAFYVHRTVTDIPGTDINFTNSMREAENSFFFKKEQNKIEIPKIKLSVLNSENMYNEIVVILVDDATNGIDPKYDGFKPEGNAFLSFYSLIGDRGFLFQGVPMDNDMKSIPLGINAGIEGEYVFSSTLIEYMPEEIGVFLEDKVLNKIIDLRKHKNYSVSINQTGRYNDRFVLHFNVNHAPHILNEIADKTINSEEFSSFYVSNTFADDDFGDEITYSASLSSGSMLPSWLSFNSGNYSFSGTPMNSDAGQYPIRVTATDSYGASVYDDFNLTVLSSVNVEVAKKLKISVYPNPTNGILYISSTEQKSFKYQISDVTGKVLQRTNSNSFKEQVDISTFTSGIYFVKIFVGNKTSDFKIFLQK